MHAVAKSAQYFNRSPDRLRLAEVRDDQIHLVSTGASWASFNVAVCAPRFFYGITLERSAIVERIPYARKRQQLPVILSADEVTRFLAAVPSLKHRTALMAAYAAGLRVSEVVRLKIADIDSGRMLIRNKAAVYAILFKAAAETLSTIAADRRHLGADIGFELDPENETVG